MKKNVGSIIFHCSDLADKEARHKWCCRNEDSWCSYWNAKKDADGKNKLNIPPNIKDEPEILKQLFDRFRDEELLSQCLHGKTQNVKEALNGVIWTKCPTNVFVNKNTLEMGVSSAVLEFRTKNKKKKKRKSPELWC